MKEILGFCEKDPTADSWVTYFDDLQEANNMSLPGFFGLDLEIKGRKYLLAHGAGVFASRREA